MEPIQKPNRQHTRPVLSLPARDDAQRHFEQNANGDAGKPQDRDGLADTRAAVAAQDARAADRVARPRPIRPQRPR
jgi:hypothetical protein